MDDITVTTETRVVASHLHGDRLVIMGELPDTDMVVPDPTVMSGRAPIKAIGYQCPECDTIVSVATTTIVV